MRLHRSITLAAAISAALVGSACREEAATGSIRALTDRTVGQGLELEASISRTIIRVGETAALRVSLSNTTAEPVSLAFPSGCQILPYIETLAGEVVYPSGGGWACTLAATTLRLGPGGERTVSVEVTGGTAGAPGTSAALPPGRYRAYGVLALGGPDGVRSDAVEFEVVP